jgi:hypothetical protein
MGSSQSHQQLAAFEEDYVKELRTGHPYFGTHSFLLSRTQKQPLIRKNLIFRSAAEHKQFQREYTSIERKPFSLIYPKMIISCASGIETCSSAAEVNVYFEIVGKSLFQIVRTEGCLS